LFQGPYKQNESVSSQHNSKTALHYPTLESHKASTIQSIAQPAYRAETLFLRRTGQNSLGRFALRVVGAQRYRAETLFLRRTGQNSLGRFALRVVGAQRYRAETL